MAREVIKLGNNAVHSKRPVTRNDSVTAVSKLFHFTYWFARTYGRTAKPEPGLKFDPNVLPKTTAIPVKTLEQLQSMEKDLAAKDAELVVQRALNADLDAELQQLRAEIAAAKAAAVHVPDTHDYTETDTRDFFIDKELKEAGWALGEKIGRAHV